MTVHFEFAERGPDPRLAPWIARYWEYSVHEGAPPVHHVPPDGGTSLLTAVTGGVPMLIVSGPWVAPLAVPIRPGDRFRGIRLQPGATESFLGVPAASFVNRNGPIGSVRGGNAADLALQISGPATLDAAAASLDAHFLAQRTELAHPDPLATRAVAVVSLARGRARIGAVARALDTTERTLLRRFRAATGLTPKQFARIVRFRHAALELIEPAVSLGQVAATAGYADQAHLTREWADLLGLTPGRLSEIVLATRHDNVSP